MKAYKCDVCGEYFTLKGNPRYRIIKGTNIYNTLDLCPNCQKKLNNLVEPNKREQEEAEKEEAEERRIESQALREEEREGNNWDEDDEEDED